MFVHRAVARFENQKGRISITVVGIHNVFFLVDIGLIDLLKTKGVPVPPLATALVHTNI